MNLLAIRWRRLAALGSLVLVGAACATSNSDASTADEMFATADEPAASAAEVAADGAVAIDANGSTQVGTGDFRLNDSELGDTEVEQAVAAYQVFLTATDAFRLDPAADLDDLTTLAAADVAEAVAVERADELAAADEVDVHLTDRRSTANVMNVVGDADALLLHDCVEVEADTDFWGPITTSTTLIDQIVTMGHTGTGWVVTDIDVRHTGSPVSPGLGCVPDHHAQRVTGVVGGFYDGMVTLGQDPAGGVPDSVLGLLPEDQREAAEADAEAQRDDGIVFTDAVDYTYEVLGSAPSYGDRSFVVAVCATYPDGWYARQADTGAVVEEAFAPGAQYYHELVITSLVDETGGRTDTILDAVNPGPTC